MNYEEWLIVKTAWYYYFEEMTQQKIAEVLGISRMRVIKLLEKARKTGIVQFKMREDSTSRMQLEKQLTKQYGLKDTFVIPTNPDSEGINETIARAAAMYIRDRLPENAFINMGYGDTCGRVLINLASMSEDPISCVSLTGGVNYYLPHNDMNSFNAKLYLIPAPLIASTKEIATAMQNETSIIEFSRMAQLSSITVIGIGGMAEDATIVKSDILSKNDILYLKMKGAVGDLLCHFVDKEGNLINAGIEDRLISTSLDSLKELKNVIGVSAGTDKIESIRAVLKGNYLDVLITDEETAIQLIDTDEVSPK